MLAAAAVASLTFASFAGCTSDDAGPAPSPTTSTAAISCSPADATFSWGGPVSDHDAVVSDLVVTFTRAGNQQRRAYSNAIPITWDTAQLSTIAPTSAALEEWKIALRNDLVGTGKVPTDFGFPVGSDSRDVQVLPLLGVPGRVILASVHTHIVKVAFVVSCQGATARGSLTAPLPGAFRVYTYHCATTPVAVFTAEELARCPRG